MSSHRVGAWSLSSMVEGRYSTLSTSSLLSGNGKGGPSLSDRKQPPLEEAYVLILPQRCGSCSTPRTTRSSPSRAGRSPSLCNGPSYYIAAVIYFNARSNAARK